MTAPRHDIFARGSKIARPRLKAKQHRGRACKMVLKGGDQRCAIRPRKPVLGGLVLEPDLPHVIGREAGCRIIPDKLLK